MTHEIKLLYEYCDAVLSGEKNFEVRYNDRGYQKGDRIKFKPIKNHITTQHPIKDKIYEITYVLNGWGIKENWVAFGIKEIKE